MKKAPSFHCYEEMKMCGRYYIDSDMADEIQQVVREVDQRIRKAQFTGDIHPTESAPVNFICANGVIRYPGERILLLMHGQNP